MGCSHDNSLHVTVQGVCRSSKPCGEADCDYFITELDDLLFELSAIAELPIEALVDGSQRVYRAIDRQFVPKGCANAVIPLAFQRRILPVFMPVGFGPSLRATDASMATTRMAYVQRVESVSAFGAGGAVDWIVGKKGFNRVCIAHAVGGKEDGSLLAELRRNAFHRLQDILSLGGDQQVVDCARS